RSSCTTRPYKMRVLAFWSALRVLKGVPAQVRPLGSAAGERGPFLSRFFCLCGIGPEQRSCVYVGASAGTWAVATRTTGARRVWGYGLWRRVPVAVNQQTQASGYSKRAWMFQLLLC